MFAARLSVFLLALVIPASAQVIQFQDVKGRNGIEEGYDRSNDSTYIGTKRDVMETVYAGPRRFSVGITVLCHFRGQTADLSKTLLTIFFSPDRVPKRSLDFLYLLPNNEVLAIADDERILVGVTKGSGGNNAYISLPVETYRKIVTAKKLEISFGNMELRILNRHRERWLNLLDEIDARQPKNANTGKL